MYCLLGYDQVRNLYVIKLILAALSSIASPDILGKATQLKDDDTVVISPLEGGRFFICRIYVRDTPELLRNATDTEFYKNVRQVRGRDVA